MKINYVRRLWRIVNAALICLFVFIFSFPLIWLISVSLQPGGKKYDLIPHLFSLKSYSKFLEIFPSITLSLTVSTISAILTMTVALSAVYLVQANVVTAFWRKFIVTGAISLFFLPAFTVYPGILFLSIPKYFSSNIQLVLFHIIHGFPISFLLLTALFASLPRLYFYQLLLETKSRAKAFYYGFLRRSILGIIAITTVTFSTAWCEFYITNNIATTESLKPYSVTLETLIEMYTTDYSGLAAGGVVSILVSVLGLFLVLFLQTVNFTRYHYAKKRNRD